MTVAGDVPQEQEDDEDDEDEREQERELHVGDRLADRLRPVEEDVELRRRRELPPERGQELLDISETTSTVFVPGCFWIARTTRA